MIGNFIAHLIKLMYPEQFQFLDEKKYLDSYALHSVPYLRCKHSCHVTLSLTYFKMNKALYPLLHFWV